MTDEDTVLILVPDLGRQGGVATYFNALALHERRNVEYFFVNDRARRSALRTGLRLARNYVRFGWLLCTRRYRLIHLNPSLNTKSFFRDGLFALMASLGSSPVLVLFHGWDNDLATRIIGNRLLHAFFLLTFGRCRNFIVLGERFKRRLGELGITDARVWVEVTVAETRPNRRITARAIEAKANAPGHEMIVLFMSRIIAAKGLGTAMDAVAQCRSRGEGDKPALRLWVAGEGEDLEEFRSYAASKGFDFVEFLGDVRGEAKWNALEKAHVLLFPTRYSEGLPLAVLEAMAHGLPVLTRSAGALDEVIHNGVNGFVTPSTDSGVFAEYLAMLCEDPSLYRRIALNNLRESARFTADAVGSRLLEIYARCCPVDAELT